MENEIRIVNSLLAYDCRHGLKKVMRVHITLNDYSDIHYYLGSF